MSRRKQPNPAKLGDGDTAKGSDINAESHTMDTYTEQTIEKVHTNATSLKNGIEKKCIREGRANDTDDEERYDLDYSNYNDDVDTACEDDQDDSLGSIGTEHGSWGSNTPEQASPAPSSCPTPSSSLSDLAEAEIAFTVGVTESTPYACKICNKAFARSSLLSKHEQSHTDQLQYGCSYCPRLFKHKRSRDRHIKLHTGDKKYKCVHCQTAFSRSDHLKIHMKTHDNSKPFRCIVCTRGYNTAAALTSHQQIHNKQNSENRQSPENFKCLQCPEIFSKIDLLQIHLSTNHPPVAESPQQSISVTIDEIAIWACMYCGKDFIKRSEMQHHINTEHNTLLNGTFLGTSKNTSDPLTLSNENLSPTLEQPQQPNSSPTYACDSCTMQFDSIEKLRIHENCIHWKPPHPLISNLSNYIKDGNTCLPPSQVISPELLNPLSNAQPMQLQPTDLSRKRRGVEIDDQTIPKRNNTDKNCAQILTSSSHNSPKKEEWSSYICSICGTQLPNFGSFMIHMDMHMSVNTNSSPNVVFGGYCPLCNETYRDQVDFNNHILIHALSYKTGWCCRVCKKIFNNSLEELQRHLMETHACTTYRCSVCQQIFDSKATMLVHLIKKHSLECQHYRCKFCPEQIFHNQISAETHVSQHIPRLFDRARKTATFGSYTYRNDFNSRVDRMVKNVQCPFCRQCFKGEYLQQMHMIKEHQREAHSSRIPEDSTIDQLPSTRVQRDMQATSPNISYTSTMPPNENLPRYDKTVTELICDICNSTDFKNDSELTAHKKLHHVKNKVGPVSLQCAYCNEHCKSRSDLENHMKNHQINSSKGKHKCNICDEIYSSAITLAEHKLSHCKIVSGNTCTQCKTVLSDEQSFYSHQLQHSTVMSKSNTQISLPANCIICCQTLQTDVEIKLHANFHLQHLIQKEFICSVCNRIFDTRTGISLQGFESTSENLQISVCKDCLNTCGNNKSSSNSPRPIKTENVEKHLYSCIQCPQSFESENEVKKHAAIHVVNDGTNHECHICRNIFPTALKLQLHVIEHSFFGMGQFRCYICSSVFTTANGLLSHMLEHGANAKPYECATCQMKFFFQTELDNHKYDHVLSRSVNQSLILNNTGDVNDISHDNIKQEISKMCPYCDMPTSYTYIDIHIGLCPQNPDFKRQQEDNRRIKYADNINNVENEDKNS